MNEAKNRVFKYLKNEMGIEFLHQSRDKMVFSGVNGLVDILKGVYEFYIKG